MNTKASQLPSLPEDLLVMIQPEPVPPPPPPPEPPKPMQQLAPPDIVVPKVEVRGAPPPVEPTVQATTEPSRRRNRRAADERPKRRRPPTQRQHGPDAQRGAGRRQRLRQAGLPGQRGPQRRHRHHDPGPAGRHRRPREFARIQKSSGSRELDRAAVNALSLCQFKPAMNNGVPEAGWAQIAYVWTLD
jgi:protein TonB